MRPAATGTAAKTTTAGATDSVSLKAFHVFFVSVSILLFTWLGWGRATVYGDTGEVVVLLQSVASFGFAALLVVYGRYVLRKLQGISYL